MKTYFKIILILIFNILSAQAMVLNSVKNAEKLWISQKNIVWCWAATAEAISAYYLKDISQENIAINNPNAPWGNIYVPYFLSSLRIGTNHPKDYLLDEVLSVQGHQVKIEYFNQTKALNLIRSGTPFISIKDFHFMIVFGFIEIGGEIFYQHFDPAAMLMGSQPFKTIHQYELDASWKFSAILYLEKSNNNLIGYH